MELNRLKKRKIVNLETCLRHVNLVPFGILYAIGDCLAMNYCQDRNRSILLRKHSYIQKK